MDTHSTKTAASLLKTLGVTGKALVVLPRRQPDHLQVVPQHSRRRRCASRRRSPCKDVLDAEQIIITQAALDKLDSVYGGRQRPGRPSRRQLHHERDHKKSL